jgi:hypothetical protein
MKGLTALAVPVAFALAAVSASVGADNSAYLFVDVAAGGTSPRLKGTAPA